MLKTINICKELKATVLIACLAVHSGGLLLGQAPASDPWPRRIAGSGANMLVYQPQLDSWAGNLLSAHAAVAVKGQGSSDTA